MTGQSFCVVSNAPLGSRVLRTVERCVTTPETAYDKLILVDGVSVSLLMSSRRSVA